MSMTGLEIFLTAFYIYTITLLIICDISQNNRLNKLEENIERLKKIKEQE